MISHSSSNENFQDDFGTLLLGCRKTYTAVSCLRRNKSIDTEPTPTFTPRIMLEPATKTLIDAPAQVDFT